MYSFKAYYTNVFTCKEITRDICFDGQFFNDEKECYMYAMSKAYDMVKDNECFDRIELIAC